MFKEFKGCLGLLVKVIECIGGTLGPNGMVMVTGRMEARSHSPDRRVLCLSL